MYAFATKTCELHFIKWWGWGYCYMLHVNKSIIASAEIVGPMSIGNRRKTKFKQKILSYRAEDFRRYNTKIKKKARFKEREKSANQFLLSFVALRNPLNRIWN